MTTQYLKDPNDKAWDNDPGMNEWRAFMKKYMPDADMKDGGYIAAYGVSKTMLQTLNQCNGDFSRANVMKQASNLHNVDNPMLLPGIKINTSPTDYHPIEAMQLVRWDGKTWQLFGEVLEGGAGS